MLGHFFYLPIYFNFIIYLFYIFYISFNLHLTLTCSFSAVKCLKKKKSQVKVIQK